MIQELEAELLVSLPPHFDQDKAEVGKTEHTNSDVAVEQRVIDFVLFSFAWFIWWVALVEQADGHDDLGYMESGEQVDCYSYPLAELLLTLIEVVLLDVEHINVPCGLELHHFADKVPFKQLFQACNDKYLSLESTYWVPDKLIVSVAVDK